MITRAELEAADYVVEGNRAYRRSRAPAVAKPPSARVWRYSGPCPLPPSGLEEKREQAHIVKLLRAYGCVVYNLSQPRASKQTPGIGDLWVFLPGRNGGHRTSGWFESKVEGGDIRPDQSNFAEMCLASLTLYAIGDRRAARDFLVERGLAVYVGEYRDIEHVRRAS